MPRSALNLADRWFVSMSIDTNRNQSNRKGRILSRLLIFLPFALTVRRVCFGVSMNILKKVDFAIRIETSGRAPPLTMNVD